MVSVDSEFGLEVKYDDDMGNFETIVMMAMIRRLP